MPQSTKNLVIGGTFFGLGFMAAHPQNTILLERGTHIGYEYITALQTGSGWDKPVLSKEGKSLLKEFESRNIIAKDHLPLVFDMMPVLFHMLKQSDNHVRLATDFVSVKKADGKYQVLAANASGNFTIECNRIIDTTGSAQSCPERKGAIIGKTLNALLDCESEDNRSFALGQVSVEHSAARNACYLRFPVQPKDNWIQARQKLYQYWVNRPDELKKYMLTTVAERFVYTYAENMPENEENRHWIPSGAYENPLLAYDAGAQFGEGMQRENPTALG